MLKKFALTLFIFSILFSSWLHTAIPSTGNDDIIQSLDSVIIIGGKVGSYFLFDPSSDYLRPALQGFRQEVGAGFDAMVPDANGELTSETLGIVLRLDDNELVMSDLRTRQTLTTEAEAERAARVAAEAQVAQLQAELDQLRRRREP